MEINAAEVLKFLTEGNQCDLSGKGTNFFKGGKKHINSQK